MNDNTIKAQKIFKKQYNIAIDAIHLPDRQEERIQLVIKEITPVINQIISDAMTLAIGTQPTHEIPKNCI